MKTYMTVEEFVKAYASGLHGALLGSFKEGDKAHLEDLMAWTATYAENTYQFVASMPYEVRAPELLKEEPCPPTSTSAPAVKKKK